MGILLGAIIALLLIALAVVLTLRRVRARELRAARQDTEESREKMLSMHSKEGDCVGDRSPDVVPCTSTLLDRRKGQCKWEKKTCVTNSVCPEAAVRTCKNYRGRQSLDVKRLLSTSTERLPISQRFHFIHLLSPWSLKLESNISPLWCHRAIKSNIFG